MQHVLFYALPRRGQAVACAIGAACVTHAAHAAPASLLAADLLVLLLGLALASLNSRLLLAAAGRGSGAVPGPPEGAR